MTEIRQVNDEQGNPIYPQTHAQAVIGLNTAIAAGQSVKSVNGKTGIVHLTAADIGAATPGDIPDVPVTSVNEKTGAVELDADDVGAVAKVSGKGLSSNDYTDAEKASVATIADKVDKIEGKGLSTNDYTDDDKEKVGRIDSKQDKILVSPNGSKFLLSVADDGTLSTEPYIEGSEA